MKKLMNLLWVVVAGMVFSIASIEAASVINTPKQVLSNMIKK